MKQLKKTFASIVVLIAILLSISGCFDRRELDTLGIVLGVAIDQGKNDNETLLTVQMANPVGGESSKGGKGGKSSEGGSKPFLNLSGEGQNINNIIREMQHKMSRRIYVAHNQVIVVGEDLAKNGVRDCFDFFARASEARMTLNVFVAKGEASKILEINPEFEKLPSTELMKILKDQKITSNVPIVTEFEFVAKLISKTTAAVAPMVEVTDASGNERLNVEGCAVFKNQKMIGTLDSKQTQGLLFVQDNAKNGVFLVTVADATATIEILNARSKVTPTLYSDGSIQVDINIDAKLGVGDQTGAFDITAPEYMPSLLEASSAVIKDEIQSVLSKSKELDADVFGFGDEIRRKYPDQWKEMKNSWDDQYKNIKINLNIDAKADGSGRLERPLVPDAAA